MGSQGGRVVTLWTTLQAAEAAGITRASFRREMSRERAKGRDYRRPGPDQRTPMWDADAVMAWLTARAGDVRQIQVR